jgi:hypothetical protein
VRVLAAQLHARSVVVEVDEPQAAFGIRTCNKPAEHVAVDQRHRRLRPTLKTGCAKHAAVERVHNYVEMTRYKQSA